MSNRPIRLLLVEDDDDDYLLVRDWLSAATEPPVHLERLAGYEAALDAMCRKEHDVYLLDYRLGKRDGLELLREAVAQGCGGPVILLTGRGDRGVDVEAMRAGAVDYLPKAQLNALLLERAIRYAVERRRTEEALRQAQKMEAVGRLAGGIAHDFNNLMTIVNGYSQVLLHMLHNHETAVEMLMQVHRAGERAAVLTQQLLAYSRRQMRQPKVLDLNEVVQDARKMLDQIVGEAVELTMALAPTPCRVKADPSQMDQMLINLCSNARDAMSAGGKLTIQTGQVYLDENSSPGPFQVRPGPYVRLAVSDTGCGMGAETQAHLFEPFFTTKGIGKGTGLGLAMVYGIVKQGNGYITARSEPGRGSTFHVFLPAVEAVLPAPVGDARNGTVLLVDDQVGVRQLTGMLLRQFGLTVLEAGDGAEAVRIWQQHAGRIDLLVTDMVMPRMGGQDLADRLTAACPQMKVLFLSGYTEDAVARHGVCRAETAFLQKPFSPHALVRKVAELLGEAFPQLRPLPNDLE